MSYIDYISDLNPTAWEVFLCMQNAGDWEEFSEKLEIQGKVANIQYVDLSVLDEEIIEQHKESESFEDTLRRVLKDDYGITLASKDLKNVLLEHWDAPYREVAKEFHRVVKAAYETYNIPEDDKPMKREAWANLVDSYYRDNTGIPKELMGLLPSLNNLDDPIAN